MFTSTFIAIGSVVSLVHSRFICVFIIIIGFFVMVEL